MKGGILKPLDEQAAVRWLPWVLLAAVVLAGVWARFTQLAWHFTHIDDIGVAKSIIDSKHRQEFFLFGSVPASWTYAPLQFLLTKLLVHPGQDYREVLFWGRFPSALLGCAGILAMAAAGLRVYPGRIARTLVAAAIISLSLENIIHAKQMHNYAFGVTSAILLCLLLELNLARKEFPFWWMGVNGLACAAFASSQYQLLFFMPGFYLAVLVHGLISAKERTRFLLNWTAGCAFFAAAFYPVWFYFLRFHSKSSMPGWNSGRAGEFLLEFDPAAPVWEKAAAVLKFLAANFPVVLQANVSFVPETHPFYLAAVYYGLTLLFVFGVISYFDRPDGAKKLRGLFWLCLGAVWLALLVQKKLVLSPTRHSLVLLPFMAFTIADGFGYLLDKLAGDGEIKERIERLAGAGMAALMLCLFFSGFGSFLAERKDPFDEKEIVAAVERYDADMLMRVDYTLQPVFMKELTGLFSFREEGWPTHELMYRRGFESDTLVWLSHRWKLTEENFERARKELNTFNMATNVKRYLTGRKSVPVIEPHFGDYEVVYSKEIDSPVQVDFSRRTRNGSNNLYFYVLKKKQPAA